jgi:hypothetical protein
VAENIMAVLLVIWPILLGVFIWLVKPKAALAIMERCDRSVLNFRTKAVNSPGNVAKYWRRPASQVLLIPTRSTAKIGEPFLRCGAKAALYPYVLALVAMGTLVEVELLFALGCFIAIFAIWGLVNRATGSQPRDEYEKIRRSKVSEHKCPDCDSVKVNPFLNEGDGKCSACHGTGGSGLLDQLVDATNPFGKQGTECYKCRGTGQCRSCGGNGVIYA